MKILLTHTPMMRDNYYGAEALAGLRAFGEVLLHEGNAALDARGLVEAGRDVDLIVADRMTMGPGEIFAALPQLKAMLRCAVDIRNIDVAAASQAGVLVTRAGPGFVASVTELVVGYLVDLSRGISRATAQYHAGEAAPAVMGRQLSGSTLGIIGYGSIGRALAPVGAALGMRVLVNDPLARVDDTRFAQVSFETLLEGADYVVCLAVATEATENLMDAAAFARMQANSCFINVSRGNLVDESALMDVVCSGHLTGVALDVGREPDQMPSRSLARLPNVIATPHVGGLTPPAIAFQALDTVSQVAELVRGETPHGAVNAAYWTRRL